VPVHTIVVPKDLTPGTEELIIRVMVRLLDDSSRFCEIIENEL